MATKDPPGQRFPPGRWRWTWERGGHGWRPAGGFSSVPTRCPERGGELRLSVTVTPGDAPVSWGTLRGSSELEWCVPCLQGTTTLRSLNVLCELRATSGHQCRAVGHVGPLPVDPDGGQGRGREQREGGRHSERQGWLELGQLRLPETRS